MSNAIPEDLTIPVPSLARDLAEVALGHCAHDSDPYVDEECNQDLLILIRKFNKVLSRHSAKRTNSAARKDAKSNDKEKA
jgi:hypothetical protein